MIAFRRYLKTFRGIKIFRLKWFIISVILWTLIDIWVLGRLNVRSRILNSGFEVNNYTINMTCIWLSLLANTLIGLVYFYWAPLISEKRYPIYMRLLKIGVIILAITVFSIMRFYVTALFSNDLSINAIFANGYDLVQNSSFLADIIFVKCLIVLVSHLVYQLGQKYTPGFFLSMALGRYSSPRTEQRIIMFIDLRDSTPISEQLGHEKYFLLIRDFVFHVCNAALLNQGDIYQYVGDEVIVTWPKLKKNSNKCIQTLILSRKFLQTRGNYFKTSYGLVPEFRVGIHAGPVTIGEIGVVKKELAMSGEAMNITARIRGMCGELNQKHMVSEDFFEFTNLKEWQGEDLGEISLKGIETRNIKLYGLKI